MNFTPHKETCQNIQSESVLFLLFCRFFKVFFPLFFFFFCSSGTARPSEMSRANALRSSTPPVPFSLLIVFNAMEPSDSFDLRSPKKMS